jgi:hypothetical protein
MSYVNHRQTQGVLGQVKRLKWASALQHHWRILGFTALLLLLVAPPALAQDDAVTGVDANFQTHRQRNGNPPIL